MKKFVVLCFLTFQQINFSQTDSLKFISWDIAINMSVNNVIYLDCSKLKWKEIPVELAKFTNLKKLKLNKNNLSDLPDFFINFDSLDEIFLGNNKFNSFPKILFKMKNLKKIHLYKNNISFIDNDFCNLFLLEFIDFWNNPISTLPECMEKMTNLKEIHLEGIAYGVKFQEKWIKSMPETKFYFDKPCSCKD